jgi:glycosyltransferase involved in cell wall biosynthesis
LLSGACTWRILDNASTDGTAEWLLKMARRYPGITVELSAINHRVAGGRQRLLEQVTGDIVAFLDSDVEALTPDWLERFIKPLENPAIGMTGAGGHLANADWTLQQADPAFSGEVDVLSGYCQFFRRADLQGFTMDMRLNGNGAEDDDTCLWLKAKGLQIHQVGNVGLKHIFAGTWVTSDNGYQQARAYLRQKWGGKRLLLCERERVA